MENGDLHRQVQELLVEVAVLKTRVHGKEEALRIQAAEYERRLNDLNHAHALARDTLATYLPREIFEKEHAALQTRVEYNSKRIELILASNINAEVYGTDKQTLADWRRSVDEDRNKQSGGKAMLTAIIAVIMSVVTLAATIFIHWHA